MDTPEDNVTPNAPPRRGRGRPPGGGKDLKVAVATRMTEEEAAAFDALARKLGFRNRADALRFILRGTWGRITDGEERHER